jgi:hypothetical protein
MRSIKQQIISAKDRFKTDAKSSGGATGDQGGAIAPPGARKRGRQKRGISAKEGATIMTNVTFAPGRQKPWRRHWPNQSDRQINLIVRLLGNKIGG